MPGLSCEEWLKAMLCATAIVGALFCAMLEALVTSGVFAFTAIYISYSLWLLPHIVLLVIGLIELKSPSRRRQAKKYLLASAGGCLGFLILVTILASSKVYISSWKAPFFVDVSMLVTVAVVLRYRSSAPPKDDGHEMADQP